MTHASRGNKHRCGECGAAFYDLNRTPIICPKCQAEYVATPPARSAKAARPLPKAKVEPEPEEAFEEDEILAHDEEDDEEPVSLEEREDRDEHDELRE